MSNTVDITPTTDGQLRITIRSQGERDQSATLTPDQLLGLIAQADPSTSSTGTQPTA